MSGQRPAASVLSGADRVPRRSELRAQRRRRARRRLLAVLLATVVGVAAAAVLWRTAPSSEAPPSAASGQQTSAPQAQQEIVLFQLRGPDGQATQNAVLGARTDPGDPGDTGSPGEVAGPRAAVLLVPSRLLLEVAGAGTLPLAETLDLPDGQQAADAVADALLLQVDGSWVLTADGLATLVDAVGPVPAEVDVEVVGDRDDIVLVPGPQELDGASAAAWLLVSTPGKAEAVRLARLSQVLDGILTRLVDSGVSPDAALAALGEESRSSLPEDRLAPLLQRLHAAAVEDDVRYETLPVRTIDTGDELPAYGVDEDAAREVLARTFPGAVDPAAEARTRVLLENGVGTPGLVPAARDRLVAAGLRYVGGGNAASFGVRTSVVLIPDSSAESRERGALAAQALGLPAEAVQVSGRGQSVADVVVVLGADFAP